MKRFRLVQVCNRHKRAHLWVCPWLRDGWHVSQVFDEWLILLNQPMNLKDDTEYFVDIAFDEVEGEDRLRREIYITPAGTMSWYQIPKGFVVSIQPPSLEDISNHITFDAPVMPWVKSLQA